MLTREPLLQPFSCRYQWGSSGRKVEGASLIAVEKGEGVLLSFHCGGQSAKSVALEMDRENALLLCQRIGLLLGFDVNEV